MLLERLQQQQKQQQQQQQCSNPAHSDKLACMTDLAALPTHLGRALEMPAAAAAAAAAAASESSPDC
jgi:hypothetical protein